jgi:hypothetical protein
VLRAVQVISIHTVRCPLRSRLLRRAPREKIGLMAHKLSQRQFVHVYICIHPRHSVLVMATQASVISVVMCLLNKPLVH